MDKVISYYPINDAAIELGLITTDLVDPFASTDPNIILLCRLITKVGKGLARARDWTQITKEYDLETFDGDASYELPTDFLRIKDETSWNRTTVAVVGPATGSQQWQQMQARTMTGLITRAYRIYGERLYFYPVTDADSEHIFFEYISTYWVQPFGQQSPTASRVTANNDTLWFDESLMVAGLKLAFLRAKGMDTSSAQDEYNQVYASAAGGDGVAPAIPITGGGNPRLVDTRNLPDTGWGT